MTGIRTLPVIRKVWGKDARKDQTNTPSSLGSPTRSRRSESISETPFDTAQLIEEVRQNNEAAKKETVLYLAYGSNLSAETFKGARGINPLSQVNVLVPSLALTFDLPGIPYSEPCFANTRYRKESPQANGNNSHKDDYHKDRWHKGLIGVVYEVTKADYATIIATEGGGSGYQDIVVACYELPRGSQTVDPAPHTAPFKAHTLFAPYIPPGEGSPGGRISRPDPSYAQPSARYLKLITDGAEEHALPDEYRAFLYGLRPYTITSIRQRLGQFIFLSTWMPIIIAMFAASKLFVDDKGRLPPWMIAVSTAVFRGVWGSYDGFFRGIFGDGERTQEREREGDEEGNLARSEKLPLLKSELGVVESKG
jgi:hypothetical protein